MKLYQKIANTLCAIENCLKNENTIALDNHYEVIERIEKELLPSGSGFDSGTTINLIESERNRIVLNTSYYHMDESGGYTDWTDHTVTIWPDLVFDFDFAISGEDRAGFFEYMEEMFQQILMQEYEGNV